MSQQECGRRRARLLPFCVLILGILVAVCAALARPPGHRLILVVGAGVSGVGMVALLLSRPGTAAGGVTVDGGVRIIAFPPLADEVPEWSANVDLAAGFGLAAGGPSRATGSGAGRPPRLDHGPATVDPASPVAPPVSPAPAEVGVVVAEKVGIRLCGSAKVWGGSPVAAHATPGAVAGGFAHRRSSQGDPSAPVTEPAVPPPVARLKLSTSPLPASGGAAHVSGAGASSR